MKVFTRMESSGICHPTSIALGTFDGIHLGHQKVIGRAVDLAKRAGGKSAVFTFENHPLSIIAPEKCPALITSNEDKEILLSALGVDILYRVPFTSDFVQLTPLLFIDRLLSLLSPAHIVVGPNYTFGYRGSGTPELLKDLGEQKGFQVEVQEPVSIDGQMISSTSIRQSVSQGDVDIAHRLMGRPFSVRGKVVHGDHRGRTLGFPTANLEIGDQMLLPGDGVYAANALFADTVVRALVNVGNNPTFSNQIRRVEVYLLDFIGDLYGKILTVEFCKKMRSEQTFSDIRELQTQIELDVVNARRFFSK